MSLASCTAAQLRIIFGTSKQLQDFWSLELRACMTSARFSSSLHVHTYLKKSAHSELLISDNLLHWALALRAGMMALQIVRQSLLHILARGDI